MCVHSYKSTKVTREREKKETNAENNFLKKEFGDCRNSNNTGKKTIGIVLSTLLYIFPFCLLFHVRRCVSCMCGFFMHLNEEKYEEKKHTPKLHWVVFQCAIFFFTFTFKCFDENLSYLSFDGDFRSILNLCTLCYRALYRRLLCKTSDAFESSKNKTTTKNCETKRNTIKWTKIHYFIIFRCC